MYPAPPRCGFFFFGRGCPGACAEEVAQEKQHETKSKRYGDHGGDEMNREVQIEEARAFAQACEEFSHGETEPFYRDAFHKAAEIINGLSDELSTEETK